MNKRSEVIKLRQQGMTLSEIAKELKCAKSTASIYSKEIDLTNQQKARIESKRKDNTFKLNNKAYKERSTYNREQQKHNFCYESCKEFVSSEERKLFSNKLGLKSYVKGWAAEDYIKFRLILEGFEVFVPNIPLEGCDLLVYNGRNYIRLEIKSTITGLVGLRHTVSDKKKGYAKVPKNYDESANIDFFVVYDFVRNAVFIFPFKDFRSAGEISLRETKQYNKYIDDFDSLRNF